MTQVTEVTEVTEVMDVPELTLAQTLHPLPLLLFVLVVEADWLR